MQYRNEHNDDNWNKFLTKKYSQQTSCRYKNWSTHPVFWVLPQLITLHPVGMMWKMTRAIRQTTTGYKNASRTLHRQDLDSQPTGALQQVVMLTGRCALQPRRGLPRSRGGVGHRGSRVRLKLMRGEGQRGEGVVVKFASYLNGGWNGQYRTDLCGRHQTIEVIKFGNSGCKGCSKWEMTYRKGCIYNCVGLIKMLVIKTPVEQFSMKTAASNTGRLWTMVAVSNLACCKKTYCQPVDS